MGSFEYLVYSSVLVSLAAVYGLKPVLDYGDPNLAGFFDDVCAAAGGRRLLCEMHAVSLLRQQLEWCKGEVLCGS